MAVAHTTQAPSLPVLQIRILATLKEAYLTTRPPRKHCAFTLPPESE
jgi:hypothetical protein